MEKHLKETEQKVAEITLKLEEAEREKRKRIREAEMVFKDSYFEVTAPGPPTASASIQPDYHRFRTSIVGWEEMEKNSAKSPSKSPKDQSFPSEGKDEEVTEKGKAKDTKKGKTHVVYCVVVQEFFDASNYLEWTIKRRFSEFKKLHDAIKSQFSRIPVPSLPSAGLLSSGSRSKDFLDGRQKGLDNMLAKMTTTDMFSDIEALHKFLDLGNPDRAISMHTVPKPDPKPEHSAYPEMFQTLV